MDSIVGAMEAQEMKGGDREGFLQEVIVSLHVHDSSVPVPGVQPSTGQPHLDVLRHCNLYTSKPQISLSSHRN